VGSPRPRSLCRKAHNHSSSATRASHRNRRRDTNPYRPDRTVSSSTPPPPLLLLLLLLLPAWLLLLLLLLL
jgi:hypothetical protein